MRIKEGYIIKIEGTYFVCNPITSYMSIYNVMRAYFQVIDPKIGLMQPLDAKGEYVGDVQRLLDWRRVVTRVAETTSEMFGVQNAPKVSRPSLFDYFGLAA
jgi:hypothetical protein